MIYKFKCKCGYEIIFETDCSAPKNIICYKCKNKIYLEKNND
jgi:hypothetical protein